MKSEDYNIKKNYNIWDNEIKNENYIIWNNKIKNENYNIWIIKMKIY